MKKLMIAAAVVAAMAAVPAFAQTKSAPVDTHSQMSGGSEHDMGGQTKPAQGAKNIPGPDTHSKMSGGSEHDMGGATKPAQGAKNIPGPDTHSQISGGAEHQMPATPPAKK